MSDIWVSRDYAAHCVVMKDGEKLFTFTPEQWSVICMAADSDMENQLYALKHGETMRLERERTWAANREKVRRS